MFEPATNCTRETFFWCSSCFDHQIDFYETQFGPWSISAPGIWVNDDHQYDRAKALLDD